MTPDTQCVKGLVVNYFSLDCTTPNTVVNYFNLDCMTPDTQCVKLVVNYFSLDCTTVLFHLQGPPDTQCVKGLVV